MFAILEKIDSALDRFCGIGLTISVAAMLGLTLMNIIMRWLGHSYLWVEPLVRHLVFLCAFLGGAIAISKHSHIGIDVIGKVLEARGSHKGLNILRSISALASTIVVIGLTWASVQFMNQELEYGKTAFLGIHSGVLVGVLPFGFGLLAFRFFFQFIKAFFPKESQEA